MINTNKLNSASKNTMKITLRLSTLALLALVSLSLVGCDEPTHSEASSTPQQRTDIKHEPEPEPSPAPAKPSIGPIYENGPGGSFYGH
jgi:hypothetical protein